MRFAVAISDQKQIFMSAIDIESVADRNAYLDQACREDSLLRQVVDELLAAHEQQSRILDRPAEHLTDLRHHLNNLMTVLGANSNGEFDSSQERVCEIVGNY